MPHAALVCGEPPTLPLLNLPQVAHRSTRSWRRGSRNMRGCSKARRPQVRKPREPSILLAPGLRTRHDARDVRIFPWLEVGLLARFSGSLDAARGLQPLALPAGFLLTTLQDRRTCLAQCHLQ